MVNEKGEWNLHPWKMSSFSLSWSSSVQVEEYLPPCKLLRCQHRGHSKQLTATHCKHEAWLLTPCLPALFCTLYCSNNNKHLIVSCCVVQLHRERVTTMWHLWCSSLWDPVTNHFLNHTSEQRSPLQLTSRPQQPAVIKHVCEDRLLLSGSFAWSFPV